MHNTVSIAPRPAIRMPIRSGALWALALACAQPSPASGPPPAAGFSPASGRGDRYDVVERDTVRRTLRFADASAARRLLVDNVNGSIDVTGTDGSEVELVARREVRAESRSRLDEARTEVTLDVEERSDRILVYVDGPWRRTDGSMNYRGSEYYGYEVIYDFELRVPRKIEFVLKTVNDGDITARDLSGDFDVRNVNGAVELDRVAGSGKVSSVNGDLLVSFTENPAAPTSFKTVNGKIEVEFPRAPSADLSFKTMNGEVYTDFPVKGVPRKASFESRRGRKVYRGGDGFTAEAGGGGPELSFNTLNGDIYLSLKGEKE